MMIRALSFAHRSLLFCLRSISRVHPPGWKTDGNGRALAGMAFDGQRPAMELYQLGSKREAEPSPVTMS